MKGVVILPVYNDFSKLKDMLSKIVLDVVIINDGSLKPIKPHLIGLKYKKPQETAVEIERKNEDLKENKIGESIKYDIAKGATEKYISGKFDGVKSWNPEWPNLYNMKITLKKNNVVLHAVTERIGFRTVELREHDGFYINNEKA